MHLQPISFVFAAFTFALVIIGVTGLPTGRKDTILSGWTSKSLGVEASSGIEDVKLDLTKRHKHPKNKEHSKDKGRDDDSDNGDVNDWLSSASDEWTVSQEENGDTSMGTTSSEEGGSIADIATAKLAKHPVDRLISHDISAASSQGKLFGLKADTRHFLNKDGVDDLTSQSLSSADSPALLHGHPSTDYYEGGLNPNLGGDSLSRSVGNLEDLFSL